MKFIRTRSKCSSCPLNNHARVHGDGNPEGGVAFIGEAPGEMEELNGIPFTGKSGGFFNWAIGNAGMYRTGVWVTNVICCRPAGNKIDTDEGRAAVECCREGFLEEIEWLKGQGVRSVGVMGATAMEAMEVDGKISSTRGSTYSKNGLFVTPSYHPSYLLRMGYAKKGAKIDQRMTFVHDLKKVRECSEEGFKLTEEKFILHPTYSDIVTFFNTAASLGQDLALDLETWKGLDPLEGTSIICLGIARDAEHAIVIPFLKQYGKEYWKKDEKEKVMKYLQKTIPTFNLYIQNSLFDLRVLHHSGFIDYTNLWPRLKHDTLVLHHCVNPDLPHNLGFITSTYGETPYWKDTLKDKSCATIELPDEELWTYNARDCVVLHQIIPKLLEHLVEINNEDTYYNEELKLLPAVASMMDNGVGYSPRRAKDVKERWETSREKYRKEVVAFGVPESVNLDSDEQMRWILWGDSIRAFEDLHLLPLYKPVEQIRIRCTSCKKETWVAAVPPQTTCPKCGIDGVVATTDKTGVVKTRTFYPRNPETDKYRALLEVETLANIDLPIIRKPLARIRLTDKEKKRKVDGKARLQQIRAINNRLDQINSFAHPETFAEEVKLLTNTIAFYASLEKYIEYGTLLSTFTGYNIGSDGRVHGSIRVTGTGTGRLAMSNPNLMNLPKKDHVEAREPFIAEVGKVLLSPDYTNLEVYVLAYESGDLPLQKFLEDGGNIHDRNTIMIMKKLGYSPADHTNKMWKPIRRVAKIIQFGSIQYAGGDGEIYENVLVQCPDLNLSFKAFSEMVLALKVGNTYYSDWAERRKEVAKTHRISRTFLGRTRQLMGSERDLEKAGLNTPIQGGAAGIMNRATINIYNHIQSNNLSDKLVLQIHDQLVLEVDDNLQSIIRAKSYLLQYLSQPIDVYGKLVSFPADMEIGTSLGTLKSWEEYEKEKGIMVGATATQPTGESS